MARIISLPAAAPALVIAAGNAPAPGTFWLSHTDGVGGTDPAAAKGHLIDGHKSDIARVRLVVGAWGSVAGLEFRAELDDGGGFALLDPSIETPFAGQFFDLTGGKCVIKAALGTQPLILSVPVLGARSFRFGLTPNDAGDAAALALSASFRLVQRNLYS